MGAVNKVLLNVFQRQKLKNSFVNFFNIFNFITVDKIYIYIFLKFYLWGSDDGMKSLRPDSLI